MTLELLYDGSYDGFLSCVFECFLNKRDDIHIVNRALRSEIGGLFPCREVKTDPARATRVERGMKRLSPDLPLTVYRAWLSEIPGINDDIVASLQLGFGENTDPCVMMHEDCVKRILAADRKTGYEAHRFLGYVRFTKAGPDLYISDIEPDHDILPLIGHHFFMRFSTQRLIIRDMKRGRAIVSGADGWFITELLQQEMQPLPKDLTHDDWARYFIAIANPERKNLKLQQAFVPKKYRSNIVEFSASEKIRMKETENTSRGSG